MNQAVKQLARVGLHRLGVLRPILWRNRNKFRILTYHRFAPKLYPSIEEDLKRQCAFLRSHFEIVSLAEIGESLESGRKLPPNALAVTIDDGYRDFLLDAFPVFRAWKIPATVFLITDFLDGKLWPWWNQVEYAIRQTALPSISISLLPAGTPQAVSLESPQKKQQAISAICAQVTKIPNRARLDFLRTLPELFQVDLPIQAPADYSPLTWDEVRFLAENEIEFGPHPVTHPILPRLEGPEFDPPGNRRSKQRVVQGLRVPRSSVPNGDFNDLTLPVGCRFEAAVTTRSGMNIPGEPVCY